MKKNFLGKKQLSWLIPSLNKLEFEIVLFVFSSSIGMYKEDLFYELNENHPELTMKDLTSVLDSLEEKLILNSSSPRRKTFIRLYKHTQNFLEQNKYLHKKSISNRKRIGDNKMKSNNEKLSDQKNFTKTIESNLNSLVGSEIKILEILGGFDSGVQERILLQLASKELGTEIDGIKPIVKNLQKKQLIYSNNPCGLNVYYQLKPQVKTTLPGFLRSKN